MFEVEEIHVRVSVTIPDLIDTLAIWRDDLRQRERAAERGWTSLLPPEGHVDRKMRDQHGWTAEELSSIRDGLATDAVALRALASQVPLTGTSLTLVADAVKLDRLYTQLRECAAIACTAALSYEED